MWVEKLKLRVVSGGDIAFMVTDIQYALAKVIPFCIFDIPESGDVDHIRNDAPWLMPALENFHASLLKRGFTDPFAAVGRATSVADHLLANIQPSPRDPFNAAVGMAW